MNNSHWHRTTSLLLLGLSVDHMLGEDLRDEKPNERAEIETAKTQTSLGRSFHQDSRIRPVRLRKLPTRRRSLAFAQAD